MEYIIGNHRRRNHRNHRNYRRRNQNFPRRNRNPNWYVLTCSWFENSEKKEKETNVSFQEASNVLL
jgi:hypothetical protein